MTRVTMFLAVMCLAGMCAMLAGIGPATMAIDAREGMTLPPPLPTYTGTLDPVFWRALPPADRPFKAWEKWAINKDGRPPLPADVSAVAAKANALANKTVRASGRYATYVDPVTRLSTRYFVVTRLEAVTR